MPWRTVRDERGVVLFTTLVAILILSILVGVVVFGTMGEMGMSREHTVGTQALALAEAGAYRGLAELRHRLSGIFEANIGEATVDEIVAACQNDEAWRLVARYAAPGETSDWTEDPATGQAVLLLNGGEPLGVRGPDGSEAGRFTVTIRVGAGGSTRPAECERGSATTPESYRMFVTYDVEAMGLTRNARRVVRLSSPTDDPVEVQVERSSFARWALLVLGDSKEWLTDEMVVGGPAHTNGEWWIWGHPTFGGAVSSTAKTVRFGNCGYPVELEATENPQEAAGGCEGDRPVYKAGDLRRGVRALEYPLNPVNPARVALGLDPLGPDPTDAEITAAAADQVKGGSDELPEGIYIANDGGSLRHPRTQRATGIYVRGDVSEMALAVEDGRQAIIIAVEGAAEDEATKKILFDAKENSIEVAWGPSFRNTRSYKGLPNGVIYVEGEIASLFGAVYQNRLTIAAQGAITITDHLVYKAPDEGEGAGQPQGVLGLYSREGDVLIDGSVAPSDLYIDATILAPQGQFAVISDEDLPDKGSVHLMGGIVQREFGQFGESDREGQTQTGYRLEFRFDSRLLQSIQPPFYPQSDRYSSQRRLPDALYTKPSWQELTPP